MSDRIKSFTVILDKDYRDDDIQQLANAIKLFNGVLDVNLNVSNPGDFVERARIRNEMIEKLFKVIEEKPNE